MSDTSNGSNAVFLNKQLVFHENRSKPFWILIFVRRNGLNFLINDVIPDVVFLFRSRDLIFWIQRSFLHQNRANYIQGQMISSCLTTIYLISMSLKITLFLHLCPRWRHRFLRISKILISVVFSNIHNFAKNQYFFTRFFFVRLVELRNRVLANKKRNNFLSELPL